LIVEASVNEFLSQWPIFGQLHDVQFVAGVAGEFGEEHELGSGVSFSEAVDGVNFSPVFGEADDEFFAVSAAQEIVFGESTKLNIGGISLAASAMAGAR
jgi:hypothetical protein